MHELRMFKWRKRRVEELVHKTLRITKVLTLFTVASRSVDVRLCPKGYKESEHSVRFYGRNYEFLEQKDDRNGHGPWDPWWDRSKYRPTNNYPTLSEISFRLKIQPADRGNLIGDEELLRKLENATDEELAATAATLLNTSTYVESAKLTCKKMRSGTLVSISCTVRTQELYGAAEPANMIDENIVSAYERQKIATSSIA